MIFLLGRQAMLGHEPPTYFRSMTAVFIPFFASVQEINLPAAPLPSTRRAYSSGSMARDAGAPGLRPDFFCGAFHLFLRFLLPCHRLFFGRSPPQPPDTFG